MVEPSIITTDFLDHAPADVELTDDQLELLARLLIEDSQNEFPPPAAALRPGCCGFM